MTHEFYEKLQLVTGQNTTTLSPGPLKIGVSQSDAMAARLILWLEQVMPDEATIGDLLDVLAAATWWVTFWSSLDKESGAEEKGDHSK